MRQWPIWLNPVPLSLIWWTQVVPSFLRCYVICHAELIAQCGKVLQLPLRSYRLYNRISQFRFDSKVSLIGDLPGVGLAQLDLSLSMWISMKSASQFSSCDVNVNSAINVLKFQLGRFQNIVMQMSRSICPINPRRAQMVAGIVKSHCLSYCRRFWKGMDRLTRDKSVLRCSRMTCKGLVRANWGS